jgi:hypothetical protein
MKSSFVKISMLLGAASFLAAGSADAKTQAENDVLNILPQESAAEQLGVSPAQTEAVEQNETFEQAVPVEQVESNDLSNEASVNEIPADSEEQVAVYETSEVDEEAVAVNEISVVGTTTEEDSNIVVSEAKSEDEGDEFEIASSMSSEDLADSRGAFSPSNSSVLQANSSNNSVNNSVTGGNVISEGAFNSNSGLVNVIQNSGNNVLIQSSTIVNVQMNQ